MDRTELKVDLVSWFGLAVRHLAGKQKDLNLIPLWLSSLQKLIVICGHCPVTKSLKVMRDEQIKLNADSP